MTTGSYAEAAELLPEWETVRGPMHATPAFIYPVYAKDCRPRACEGGVR